MGEFYSDRSYSVVAHLSTTSETGIGPWFMQFISLVLTCGYDKDTFEISLFWLRCQVSFFYGAENIHIHFSKEDLLYVFDNATIMALLEINEKGCLSYERRDWSH